MAKKQIGFRVPDKTVNAVNEYADRHELDRSKAARELLDSGLRTHGYLSEREPVADGGQEQTPLGRYAYTIGTGAVYGAGALLLAATLFNLGAVDREATIAGAVLLVAAGTFLSMNVAEPALTERAQSLVDRLGGEA